MRVPGSWIISFQCAMAQMGIDRVMFAVDYPMEIMSDGTTWFDNTPLLTEAQRHKIARTNTIELFKLKLAP